MDAAGFELPPDRLADLLLRLRRVEGQVRGLQRMVEEGRGCAEVVTQFAAAIRALEHAGYRYFSSAMAECLADPERAAAEGYSPERLEELFLRLS